MAIRASDRESRGIVINRFGEKTLRHATGRGCDRRTVSVEGSPAKP